MLEYVLKCYNNGLAVLPPKEDFSKAPCEPWKNYQTDRPSEGKVRGWYKNGRAGLGFLTGQVSGNLEVLDFDHADMFPEYLDTLKDYCPDLVEKLTCVESTPKGIHVYYRCPVIAGNQKLAGDEKGNVLIETRGEGGYIVAAPSHGRVNNKGSYDFVTGDHTAIPMLTEEERRELHSVASIFDRRTVKSVQGIPSSGERRETAGLRPGDDYNARTTWEEVLGHYQWECIGNIGGTLLWRKPGSSSRTHHATTNHNGSDLFYCFSSAADPFEPEHSYSRFAVLTLMDYAGDYTEAASALSAKGYGDKTAQVKETAAYMSGPVTPIADKSQLVSLAKLMKMDLPPMRWVVEGLIPEGCIILAGAPKIGKSWLSLDMALSITTPARKLFGHYEAPHGTVLYLALEDSHNRLQSRVQTIMDGLPAYHPQAAKATDKAIIELTWPKIGPECMERFEKFMEHYPDTKMVIIDTFQKVKPMGAKGANAYESDYDLVAPLQQFAIKYHIAVILVTHLRKGNGMKEEDPFEQVTGSMAISGAADATIRLKRGKASDMAEFYIRGRDVEEQCILLKNVNGVWFYMGTDEDSPAHMDEIREYVNETGCTPIQPSKFNTWYKANYSQDIANCRSIFKRLYEAGHLKKVKDGFYVLP